MAKHLVETYNDNPRLSERNWLSVGAITIEQARPLGKELWVGHAGQQETQQSRSPGNDRCAMPAEAIEPAALPVAEEPPETVTAREWQPTSNPGLWGATPGRPALGASASRRLSVYGNEPCRQVGAASTWHRGVRRDHSTQRWVSETPVRASQRRIQLRLGGRCGCDYHAPAAHNVAATDLAPPRCQERPRSHWPSGRLGYGRRLNQSSESAPPASESSRAAAVTPAVTSVCWRSQPTVELRFL